MISKSAVFLSSLVSLRALVSALKRYVPQGPNNSLPL
jgi:hypothetical protein